MKKICLLFLTMLSVSALLAQPANDDPCNAEMLTIGADCSTTLPYTNVGATSLPGEGFACYPDGSADNTVWFTFVPTTGAVSITTDFGAVADSSDTQLTVYELSGTDCTILPNYIPLYCNEDILPAPVNSYFNAGLPPVAVTPGNTYYIQVDAFNNFPDSSLVVTNPGPFCILVSEFTPPFNDECVNAIPFGGFGANTCKIAGNLPALQGNLTTIGATATIGLDSLSCDSDGLNATVYYSFPFGQDPTAEVEFQLLAGENVNVAVVEPGCDMSPGVASNNCVNGLTAVDDGTVTSVNAALFSGLDAGVVYNLVVWTDEGNATDFDFCMIKRPAGYYECGDNECYDLAESYSNCESDCPCVSSIDLVSLITGAVSDAPTGVCAEIIGGTTDSANPGIYIPFQVNTLDSDLSGSSVTATQGSIFTSNSGLNFFGYATNPLIPLPNNESDGFLNYLFLSQAEIDAGGTVTINFTSDAGACSASIDFNLANLQGASSGNCGNCNLVITPDYTSLQCPGFNTSIEFEGAVGDLWLSQNNTTVFDAGADAGIGNNDIALPYTGGYPTGDFTLTVYDSGQPNCAFTYTLTFGDFFCDADNMVNTFCRLDPAVDANNSAICDDATGNILVPVAFGNNVTGTLTSSPDVISGSGLQGPYYASIDPNNCAAIDITVSDESDVDAFSGTPIFNISSPASIAGGIANVGTNGADDWGVNIDSIGVCGSNTTEVTGSIVLVDDLSEMGTIFCDPDGGTPAAEQCTGIAGNIAMVDRGSCTFVNKASNAQQCGATAVIICNNDVANPDDVIPMGGAGTPAITIPTIMLSFNDCAMIKAELSGGVQACIGAPQTVPGCERTFTLDVCADYSVMACDDGDCSTENDVATVGPNGEVCACAGTAIVCADGETFNTDSCMCESDDVSGCTDMCDSNFDPEANISDPAACAGYDTACDDSDCNTEDSYDTVNCLCVNTPIDPPNCDDSDCTTEDTYDSATCACVNTPITPPDCDDSDCATEDSYDTATCTCVNTPIDPPNCDDSDCTTEDSYDSATCTCVNTPIDPPDCDDMDCNTEDSYDTATCTCVNTPIDPPSCDDSDCTTEDSYDSATCTCVNTPIDPPDCDDMDCNTEDSYDTTTCTCVNTPIDPPSCDDGICGTEDSYDAATCDCVNTPIDPPVCDDGVCSNGVETYNAETCECEAGVPGEIPTCDDGDCNTEDTYDEANCVCINTPIDPPNCDDNDCNTEDSYDLATCTCINETLTPPDCDDNDCNTEDTYDSATCTCVNTPIDPPSCDDGICGTEDSYDSATCTCVNTPIDPPVCDDGVCSNGVETYNAETCECEDGVPGEIPTCDDGDCGTEDSYDADNCICVNTPIDPPTCNTDCSLGDIEVYDAATCACVTDIVTVSGCTDAAATNFDAAANCDDDSCIYEMCTDPCAPNFEAAEACEPYSTDCNTDCTAGDVQVWDEASCSCVTETVTVSGCTDPNATNYNEDANCDDSSCMFMVDVMGCTDMAACNYNASANADDGSCVYAVAGSISTTSATSICVDDGVDEPIEVSVDDAGQGANGAWVITDENAMILALPAEPPFVLDGAGVGTCLIWWVNFSDDTFAPAVGDDAAALVTASSCAALSNSIAIARSECGGECTPPSAGDFNCEE